MPSPAKSISKPVAGSGTKSTIKMGLRVPAQKKTPTLLSTREVIRSLGVLFAAVAIPYKKLYKRMAPVNYVPTSIRHVNHEFGELIGILMPN